MATPPRAENKPRSFKELLKHQKWLTLIALPILLFTTYAGYYSLWGLLFIFWGLTAIKAGQAYLVEPISNDENPILFWIISIIWVGFGIMYILTDIYPSH